MFYVKEKIAKIETAVLFLDLESAQNHLNDLIKNDFDFYGSCILGDYEIGEVQHIEARNSNLHLLIQQYELLKNQESINEIGDWYWCFGYSDDWIKNEYLSTIIGKLYPIMNEKNEIVGWNLK